MPLTDPATSYASLVGVDPTNSMARQAGKKRVVPGDPSRSFLMDKITGAMEFGEGDPMPQNEERLSPDEIALIRRWIQAGAPSGLTSSRPGAGRAGHRPAEPVPGRDPASGLRRGRRGGTRGSGAARSVGD
jgi:hypothetical protein